MKNKILLSSDAGKNFERTFTPFIQKVIQTHELPGLAIGVVVDGQIVYARGFGVKRLGTREPISTNTIFHMASISKPFVATGVMQLVEQGLVQLEAPVTTYLPYFKLADERFREITIQQMLSHVSGMPDVEDYEWNKPQYDAGALERYVRSLSPKKLLTQPGEKFAYSNMAFECLGDVIAKVSGMSFDDYIKENILSPAGMVESTFLMKVPLPEDWAAPHVRLLDNIAWKEYPYNRMHGPSSTLHSNAVEMCNWAICNLNRGNFKGNRILSPASYDLLWKPWADTGDGRQIGLSWFISEHRGEKTIAHGGGDTGFRTYLAMLPEKGAAVVVLCNLSLAQVDVIAYSALDILLGLDLTPVLPRASLLVCKTMQEKGITDAVAQWDFLKAHHLCEYDFGSPQFPNLYLAVGLDRIEEAERLARLCAKVLPQPEVDEMKGNLEKIQNEAARAALKEIMLQ